MRRVICLIPFYNEAPTIVSVLDEVHPLAYKMVLVDDGSLDGSLAHVQEWARGRERVIVLHMRENQGMAEALRMGLSWIAAALAEGRLAEGDLVVTLDADGQHPPSCLPGMLERVRTEGLDVLLGRRDLRRYPLYKRLGNWGLSRLATLLSGVRYLDSECGFRCMRAGVIPRLLPYFHGQRYSCAFEIAVIAGCLGMRVANDYPFAVPWYRSKGARVEHGLQNAWMGLLAWRRVRAGRSRCTEADLERARRLVLEALPAAGPPA